MAIHDRGMKKWQFAFGHPELIKGQRDLWRDQERLAKPIVDPYELEEFDQRIVYAMEYNLSVIIAIWSDGFTSDIKGWVHYVDPLTHQLRIEAEDGLFHRITFEDVVAVVVVD
ncbi:YolD-like family protein [Bacillus salipaludis]|uniref:YolD-like family protein n=1 Tax=Bacillus salipaludis TaxID=2547811 RepID=UPI002E1E4C1E|nr:YolD-like family protein [Bacillus salipaludis]